ncbi:MAG: putative Ig domain-containing protein [Thermodesulfobacteriota bacterium]
MFRKLYTFAFILLLLTGCSQKEEPPENLSPDLPAIKTPSTDLKTSDKQSQENVFIKLSPEHPRKGDALILKTSGLEGPVTYKWYVNGTEIPNEDKSALDYANLKKGDEVTAEVASNNTAHTSNAVTIVNTPPLVKDAWILPGYPVRGSVLTANSKGYDVDGDEVEFSFEWYLNDRIIQKGESSSFSEQFVRGDKVTVKFIPHDGEIAGNPLSREVTIKNSPPVVETSLFNTVIKDGVYYADVNAVDPDEDRLVYKLQDAPQGMSIDEDTGKITWKIPQEKGRYEIVISVTDTEGAKALLTMPMMSRSGE